MATNKRLSPEALAARKVLGWFTAQEAKDKPFLDAFASTSPTAMKGLSRIANEAEVREQVVLLLRYQVSRGLIPAAVGARLQTSIDEVHTDLARERPGQEQDSLDREEMARIRALFGQIVRWHTIAYGEASARQGGGR